MNWLSIESVDDLNKLEDSSFESPQVIFKHSTRCSISHMAKSRLERVAAPERLTFHCLDLLTYRSISNEIAHRFHVNHESPQLLLIQNGKCIYNESHNGISMEALEDALHQ